MARRLRTWDSDAELRFGGLRDWSGMVGKASGYTFSG